MKLFKGSNLNDRSKKSEVRSRKKLAVSDFRPLAAGFYIMKIPISVVVITKNEEKNIRECLKSVAGWADEIVIMTIGNETSQETLRHGLALGADRGLGARRDPARRRVRCARSW